jgi:hypothetical protein
MDYKGTISPSTLMHYKGAISLGTLVVHKGATYFFPPGGSWNLVEK